MELLKAPIPGQSLTDEPKNYPWENPPEITDPEEAIARFQRLLVQLGVEDALREAGITSGETVRISDHELEWLT